MAADDLNLVLERVRQNRTAGNGTARAALATTGSVLGRSDSTLHAGDRVFDLESGTIGQVVDQSPTTPFSASGIFVRFDDGRVVARPIESLVLRPTPPSARQ